MATYEVEHSIPAADSAQDPPARRRRPSMTTFHSALSSIDTSSTSNPHAVPTPVDASAPYRLLANAFEVMRAQDGGSGAGPAGRGGFGGAVAGDSHAELMDMLIQSLMEEADAPPREVAGVSEEFLAGLDRVSKKSIKPNDVCPICNNPFLEDKYPLVVRLPCHKSHIFDLECITPWLKLHTTCPLDRRDLVKKKAPLQSAQATAEAEEEEEVWDDMYA
ncbi:MAG: hypothetical protein M1838_005074 [Thelocarpon superellum]|nr:MAG: hypothetical protein M1838_005074 [Thelocarpon superellum]